MINFGGRVPPLKSRLAGESLEFNFKNYRIFYKTAGQTDKPALLFVHGVGAGASSFEWRHNFGPLAEHFQVFAYDLLGFGLSQRPDVAYSTSLYLELLASFLKEVVKRPAFVVAASLSAGHTIQVALNEPALIEKLVLIVPAGANQLTGKNGPNVTGNASYPVLRLPGLGKTLFSVFASRFGIENFLQSFMYYDRNFITQDLVNYYYISSHQPGAEHAPLAFFAGRLNAEIGASFSKINQPVLLAWGKEAGVTPPRDGFRLLQQNPHAQMVILDKAKLACNEERAPLFNALVTDFLKNADNQIKVASSGYRLVK